ncbi:MAG: DUF29 domain-containing protein [Cyanobacteria bacterium QS_8_64_29]|nr:MAG: DUF29 domain-containing protein [Cyanobacteria bacterium QS_8_64_29]
MQNAQSPNLAQLYETDYARWLDETIEQLKAREFDALDLSNLIEELADMGCSQKQALASNLELLLRHLLKWKYQPTQQTPSWRLTIRERRKQIRRLLRDSSSLKPELERRLPEEYANARELAADETGLSLDWFPTQPPFGIEQALDDRFWPQS